MVFKFIRYGANQYSILYYGEENIKKFISCNETSTVLHLFEYIKYLLEFDLYKYANYKIVNYTPVVEPSVVSKV